MEFFSALDVRYREPQRYYHTWDHVLDCLAELERVKNLCVDPVAVEMAVWYHDAVYAPGAQDNEAKSAALARQAAVRMGLPPAQADEIWALVSATGHAQAPPGGPYRQDLEVLLDIDLAILGRGEEDFAAYEHKIRREYGFLCEASYRRARRQVLESFLSRPRLYLTAWLRKHYEARARRNLIAALERLS